ncbi:MAG: DNA-3-methyladenine glycosylase family protein [Coprobacillaceae bacterium]
MTVITSYLEYGQDAMDYLRLKDPLLGEAINKIGPIKRKIIPDMFMAIINSIIGQQISTKAQETIWKRFIETFHPITPEHINSMPLDTLQGCGISFRKASYINGLAENILDGSLDLEQLPKMTDDEVCKCLSEINGIGVWTAEMLMTFSMQRLDIFSWGDIAIHRGLRMVYHHRKITPKLFAKYKRRYSPYATVASLYLWELASGKYEEYVDYAPKTPAQKKLDAKRRRKQSKEKSNSK